MARFDFVDQGLADEAEVIHLNQRITGQAAQTERRFRRPFRRLLAGSGQAVEGRFDPGASDQVGDVVEKVAAVRGLPGAFKAGVADQVGGEFSFGIDPSFIRFDIDAPVGARHLQRPRGFPGCEPGEDRQRQAGPGVEVPVDGVGGERIFASDRLAERVGGFHHVIDRFLAAVEPHLLRVEDQIAGGAVAGEEFVVRSVDFAAPGRNPDPADRLARNLFPVFLAGLDLHGEQPPGQNQETGQKNEADQKNPQLFFRQKFRDRIGPPIDAGRGFFHLTLPPSCGWG